MNKKKIKTTTTIKIINKVKIYQKITQQTMSVLSIYNNNNNNKN